MNKRGFTLIEIIICLVLVVGIGTVSIFGIRAVNNNITRKELTEIEDKIYEAVNVYMETDNKSKTEINKNKNASVIPLSVLKDEGLIDFADININDHYVLTVLGSENKDDACLGTTTIGTWQVDSKKEIFLCTNQDDEKIKELEEKIKKLEETSGKDLKSDLVGGDGVYIAKGANPNNWVEIEVSTDTRKDPYFMEASNKWRIMAIDEEGKIELVYSSLAYSSSGWSYTDITSYSKTDSTKKLNILYNNIINKSWIISSPYRLKYDITYGEGGFGFNYKIDGSYNLQIGTINVEDYARSLLLNESYLLKDISSPVFAGYTYNIYMDRARAASLSANGILGYAGKDTVFNYFKPVIILNDKVELEKNNTCGANVILGTEECPYRLSCTEC